jgi:hypothetical protein
MGLKAGDGDMHPFVERRGHEQTVEPSLALDPKRAAPNRMKENDDRNATNAAKSAAGNSPAA